MFHECLKAQLPLLSIQTTDPVNVEFVVGHLAQQCLTLTPTQTGFVSVVNPLNKDTLSKVKTPVVLCPTPLSWDDHWKDFSDVYNAAAASELTIVLVNLDHESHAVTECGLLTITDDLIENTLEGIIDESFYPAMVDVLRGLSLREIAEVIKLCLSVEGFITPELTRKYRSKFTVPTQGLEAVDTVMSYYRPDKQLDNWLSLNKKFFLSAKDSRLVPRGLLFTGLPGVGKTEGAKYVSNHFDVPLYLVDIPGMLTRWQGEAEANLQNALNQLDSMAPCVALLDEVEKLFDGSAEGTTNRLLGKLLWWLAQHKTQVFVIMTCNAIDKIPKELYRPGRIDQIIDFQGLLNVTEAKEFVTSLLKTYQDKDLKLPSVSDVMKLLPETYPVTQVDVAAKTANVIKTLN